MVMKKLIYLCLLSSLTSHLSGQTTPFLDEVYDHIKISYDHIYGENATILYFPFVGEAIKEPLFFDLYEPDADPPSCLKGWPLIIFFHSGNFFPYPDNQSVVGTKRDSSVVEMCRRLARSGFVVASADYRLGWDPFETAQIARITLINAAYRGVQDANTCIRYFKKTVAEEDNIFKIDTSRIILWGDDTGGYLAIHAGCLDRYDKIPTASDGKFLIPTGNPNFPFVPMIIQSLNGDVEGKHYGVMDSTLTAIFPYPPGDTLCYANYPEYSSSFRLAVNMAGAVADTAWIDPGQPPVICIHVPYDQTSPYKEGYVNVGQLQVVKVQGSYLIEYMENLFGNNDCMNPPHNISSFQMEVTGVANSRNDGLEGLFPMYGDTITDFNPWNFWKTTGPDSNVNSTLGLLDNPHMSRIKAETYIDSIFAYVLPRIYTCLDFCTVGTGEIMGSDDIHILTYPNPTMNEVFIATSEDYPIKSIGVHNLKGALIALYTGINFNYFHLPVNKLIPGQYVLKFQFDKGIAARQIVIE
jgi:hypothetical protein